MKKYENAQVTETKLIFRKR